MRAAAEPRRAVFMTGDSHAGALAKGLMVALDGAASVVWVATGGGCGYVGVRVMQPGLELWSTNPGLRGLADSRPPLPLSSLVR